MALLNTKDRYGWAAIALHWLVVVAVLAMFYFGLRADWAGESGDRALRRAMMSVHTGLGPFVVALVVARVAWSLVQPRPKPLGGGRLLNAVARLTHYALLLGLLILVVSGPLAVWSGGNAINVFGWATIPSPFATRNEPLHETAESVHAVGRWMLYVGVSLHVLGAFKHVLFDRDSTLQRMLWVKRPAD